ncbi:MAG: GTP-binding protein [Candidatus Hodarchaeales archaeon]|jgi:elongation factor 1-alpha
MNSDVPTSKPSISLVVLGHVDHGKSTTLGHFLYELGTIDQRAMEKFESEAEMLKMSSWKWAFVLDSLPEERERGLTEDIAFFPFETPNRRFLLIDAPGHRDFVKNALRGAAQADACILMVSANPGDLKSGLKVGTGDGTPGGQTREHAILASVLGVQEVCIAINKMDTVNYSKEQYEATVDATKELLQEIQSPWVKKLSKIPFIPISGFEGVNLTKSSSELSWYKGPTLLEALDLMEPPVTRKDLKLRFIVQDAYERPGVGTVVDGRVVSGTLRMGAKVLVQPGAEAGSVKEIWGTGGTSIQELQSGEHGVINLQGITKDILEQPGLVIGEDDAAFGVADLIATRLLILESLGRPITPGTNFVMHIGTAFASAQVVSIDGIDQENPKFKKMPRKNPVTGKLNLAFPSELALVTLRPSQPMVAEPFKEHPVLGRVILRHMGTTVAVGIIQEVIH